MSIFEDAYRDHLHSRLGLPPAEPPAKRPPRVAPFASIADQPLGSVSWADLGLSVRARRALQAVANKGYITRYKEGEGWHEVPMKTVRDLAALEFRDWIDVRRGVGPATARELLAFFGRS